MNDAHCFRFSVSRIVTLILFTKRNLNAANMRSEQYRSTMTAYYKALLFQHSHLRLTRITTIWTKTTIVVTWSVSSGTGLSRTDRISWIHSSIVCSLNKSMGRVYCKTRSVITISNSASEPFAWTVTDGMRSWRNHAAGASKLKTVPNRCAVCRRCFIWCWNEWQKKSEINLSICCDNNQQLCW